MQRKDKGASGLGYLTHYVVDGGKARVILNVLVTPAEVTENSPMLELLLRSRFRWRLRPRSVTGDAAYGTLENVAGVEKAGFRAYVVLPNHDERRGPLLGKDEFVYDAEKDILRLPPRRGPAPPRARLPAEIDQVRRQALSLQPVCA